MSNTKRKTKTFICEQCGKEFIARADKKQKFCSIKCFGLHIKKSNKNAICPVCNKEFIKRNKTTKYCSNQCRSQAQRKRFVLQCDVCGKEFERHKCHIKENNFCSRECYAEWEKQNCVGEKSPRYKGGIYHSTLGYTFLRQPDKTYKAEHRIVAEKIIGRKLQENEVVHHIDGNKQNNSKENLVVITRGEHAKIHRGKRQIEIFEILKGR